jgi:hypothetical protein
MSRDIDVNLIVNQIIDATRGSQLGREAVAKRYYERLTLGLAEYEREQVAWMVNFRLAAPVL